MATKKTLNLPKTVIEKINGVFCKYPEINTVILYGSRAKGNHRLGSDIDLCIKSTDLSYTKFLRLQNEIEELSLPWKIDLSLHQDIDNQELLKHIQTVGLVFYQKLLFNTD